VLFGKALIVEYAVENTVSSRQFQSHPEVALAFRIIFTLSGK